MRYAPEHKVDVYADAVRGLVSLEDDPEKRLKYADWRGFICVQTG